MEKVLKGLPVTKTIYRSLKTEISEFKNKPHLVINQIGKDPASDFYIQNLEKKGNKIGLQVSLLEHDAALSQENLIALIHQQNNDKTIHGIMLQKPLPVHIRDLEINQHIAPEKDVDGFHPLHLGNLLLGEKGMVPCTPSAVIEMCKFYEFTLAGKYVVILGRSSIVGKPLANLLLQKSEWGNATVTICHSRTQNLEEFTKKADILVAAIGKANFVTGDMIKKNSIILDVGVNQVQDENGKEHYVGDADYKSCYDKALAITPVPGGIGSVTTALLLKNVVSAYKNQEK